MTPDELYIKKSVNFRKIMKEGKKNKGPHFILYSISKKYNDNKPRIGISISKASVPLATRRNKIKRCIKEWWRSGRKDVPYADYVLIVKKGTDKIQNARIRKELSDIFNKVLS